MQLLLSIDIDRPKADVAALLADPSEQVRWMDDLVRYEPLNGEPGQVGSQYQLTFKSGKRTMEFIATQTSVKLPDEMAMILDSPMVHIEGEASFEALSPKKTRYTLKQDFQFKGALNKLAGFVMRRAIERQQQEHVENFKRVAEEAGARTYA